MLHFLIKQDNRTDTNTNKELLKRTASAERLSRWPDSQTSRACFRNFQFLMIGQACLGLVLDRMSKQKATGVSNPRFERWTFFRPVSRAWRYALTGRLYFIGNVGLLEFDFRNRKSESNDFAQFPVLFSKLKTDFCGSTFQLWQHGHFDGALLICCDIARAARRDFG